MIFLISFFTAFSVFCDEDNEDEEFENPPDPRDPSVIYDAFISMVNQEDLEGISDRLCHWVDMPIITDALAYVQKKLSVTQINKILSIAEKNEPARVKGKLLDRISLPKYSITFDIIGYREPEGEEEGHQGLDTLDSGYMIDGYECSFNKIPKGMSVNDYLMDQGGVHILINPEDEMDYPEELSREEAEVEAIAQELRYAGATEGSSSEMGDGDWFSTTDQNYRTGEDTTKNYHIENFSKNQWQMLRKKLKR